MNAVPFLDITPHGRLINQLNIAYDRVFNSSQYVGGKEVEAFEQEWADYCQAKYCVGVGNGHDALMLACRYFYEPQKPIKPVAFTPWKTCLPTWSAARNGNLSPFLLNGEAQGIAIAVHIYGDIAVPPHKQDTIIIEDCAQAHGAKFRGRPAGSFGNVAAWSFYPTKNLGALGDAGAVTTNDLAIAEYVREMSHYGTPDHNGINSRLDPMQAAFLRAKLPFLDDWNEQREENAWCYLNNIKRYEKIKLPIPIDDEQPCWHIFAIETDERDDLREFLAARDIETMIHYPHVPYPNNWREPEAEAWVKQTLSLPVAPHVTPHICKRISEFINQWMGA